MKNILIIDTNAGNLFSLKAAIKRLGATCQVLTQPTAEEFSGIVIPGQGRFASVLQTLKDNGWTDYLLQARKNNTPILGICVGMQIFFEASEEDPEAEGFMWFKGKAQSLNFPKKPMVGWAQLNASNWQSPTVYFVNSYAIKDCDESIATVCYGEQFCAAIQKGSFTGVQFHPEKSSVIGRKIIAQALNIEEL